LSLGGNSNRRPSHQDSHLYRDVHGSCSFLIISQWSRKQAFDDFIASPTFAKVASWGKERILADRPRHQVYGADEPAAQG